MWWRLPTITKVIFGFIFSSRQAAAQEHVQVQGIQQLSKDLPLIKGNSVMETISYHQDQTQIVSFAHLSLEPP